jgi:hypothetical protein
LPAVAGRNYSNGDAAIGIGLVVALIAVFLPWYGASFNCGNVSGLACGSYNTSVGALSGWAGWLFFLAVLVGLAFFVLRTFVPTVQLPALPQSDAVLFVILGIFMAVMAILYLVTYGGVSGSGPGYSVGPSFGLFVGLVAGIAVAAGGFLKRSDPQSATRSYGAPGSGTSYGGTPPPPPPA